MDTFERPQGVWFCHKEWETEWPRIEEVEENQWKHLFNIVSNKRFYITEFEMYLLCDYFKLPCVLHGTVAGGTSESSPTRKLTCLKKIMLKHGRSGWVTGCMDKISQV